MNTKGDINFSIKDMFSEAWQKVTGFKGTFWAALAIVLLITIVAFIIIMDISGMIEGPAESADRLTTFRPLAEVLKLLLSVFITTPLAAGLWMISMRRSVDAPINYKMVFQYFSYWKTLWAYPVIFSVLGVISELTIHIPFLPFIVFLAMIYFAISYFMFIPLVIDKKLSAWDALETSRKTMGQHFFKMLGIVILFFLISLVSMLTIGIAFIWTLPWIYLIMGIIYRNIFGVGSI